MQFPTFQSPVDIHPVSTQRKVNRVEARLGLEAPSGWIWGSLAPSGSPQKAHPGGRARCVHLLLVLLAAERQAHSCFHWLPLSDVTAGQPVYSLHSQSRRMNCNSPGRGAGGESHRHPSRDPLGAGLRAPHLPGAPAEFTPLSK